MIGSSGELFRAWCVFQICAIGPIVRHCDTLYMYSVKVLGARRGAMGQWAAFLTMCFWGSAGDIVGPFREVERKATKPFNPKRVSCVFVRTDF